MTTVRWLQDDSDEWVKGTLLQFINVGGARVGHVQEPLSVKAVVILPSLRIALIDYDKLRVGEPGLDDHE